MNTALSLSDAQLQSLMTIAAGVPVEKRSVFLGRVAVRLRLKTGTHFTDADLADAVRRALVGLIHSAA